MFDQSSEHYDQQLLDWHLRAAAIAKYKPTLEKLGLKVDAEDVRTLIARYDVGGAPLRKSNAELRDGLAELMRKHPVLRLEGRS